MDAQLNTEPKNKKIKLDFKDSKYATGRRKRSIARVWLKKGSGDMHINGKKLNNYFARPGHQKIVKRPFSLQALAIVETEPVPVPPPIPAAINAI